MSGYKTILACLIDAESTPQTLGLALRIGRTQGAHVVALHVRPDPASAVPLVGEGMSGAMVEEMLSAAERQGQDRAQAIKAVFDEICAKEGAVERAAPSGEKELSVQWREEVGREEEVIATAGRLFDLLVMARPTIGLDVPPVMSLNAALLETGRPLLLAPSLLPENVGKNIALFWNGSIESARALASSLPLFCAAEHLSVLSAREDNAAVPGEVVKYLAWHGIKATAQCVAAETGGPQIGQTLLAKADALGADLIVMGAYTHSRLRQLIMGGVTRHLLHGATVPLLLCH